MSKHSLKKAALLLTFWFALHTASVKAQVALIPTAGTSPTTFGVDANGLLFATGTEGGGGSLSLSGEGTRMFWYPQKAAFRAGFVWGSNWDSSNIGLYSTAFGIDTKASGFGSTAFGDVTTASGYYATAFGLNNTASGYASMVLGESNTASGRYSVALGSFNTATAAGSTVFGGFGNLASGLGSTAFGSYNTASGYGATASGYNTKAEANLCFVVGRYNQGGGNQTTWVSTDPLFEIGNGTSSVPSDAVVVRKNGSMTVQGPITVTNPSSDIPVYGE